MFNWGAFTLFLYITMRMSGFVLFSPILSRRGFPGLYRAGLTLAMAAAVFSAYGGTVEPSRVLLEFMLRLLLEFSLGYLLSLVTRFFFYIPEQAGNSIDTQMGLTMARTYDPSSQSSMTVTANLLNALLILLFFEANGHVTMLRLMLTSGELVPYGEVALGSRVLDRLVEVFVECALLAVKFCLPILAAELMGQVGMGVLMKVIPQINVFAINIELKVIIGLVMLLLLVSPMSEFLLEAETQMLSWMRRILMLSG